MSAILDEGRDEGQFPNVADAWTPRPESWRRREPSPFADQSGRPLFIGACPRSGTTLLRSLLTNHPELAIPAETDFVIPLWMRRAAFGDLRDPANRRRLAQWLFFESRDRGGRRIRAGAFGRDEAVARVVASPPTLGSIFHTLFAMFAEAKGKPRWGDKRPAYAGHLDALFALFPDAQFINLIRDPRAAADSQIRAPWFKNGYKLPLASAVANWETAVRRVDRYASRLRPDQLLDVRYEDLVRDPRGTLERICAFSGLAGGAAIDEMIHRPRDGAFEPGWHDQIAEPISVASVDAWRYRLQPQQVALVEHGAGPLLERFGYQRHADLELAPSAEDLRALALQRRRRTARWRRYALGERKRRWITYRRSVAAHQAGA